MSRKPAGFQARAKTNSKGELVLRCREVGFIGYWLLTNP